VRRKNKRTPAIDMEYAVMIERAADGSFSAYVPDLPGCVSCGDSPDEVKRNIQEAIRLHIESLRNHQEPIPQSTTTACQVLV
jgi:predicted RNase H-like HicB family nuclease